MARKKRRRRRNVSQWQVLFVLLIVLGGLLLLVQRESQRSDAPADDDTKATFLDEVGAAAVANYPNSQVLPSVVTAQAALESDFGRSKLARDYHNLFGYKAAPDEPRVWLPTMEFEQGAWRETVAPFKVYATWQDSLVDHGELLRDGPSWDPDLYQDVTDNPDYRSATEALERAGYATAPDYAQRLQQVIETYHLTELDEQIEK